jgi:hypothetical protein
MHSRLMAWCSGLLAGGAFACVVGSSACGSSSSGSPLGGGADGDDSGSGSSSSGSGSGAGTSSSSGTASHDSGTSSGLATDASEDAPSVVDCGGSCDLSTHTCCLASDMTGHCVPHGTACGSLQVSFTCEGASDCPSGQVCCGVADQTKLEAGTVCQATCPTMSSSATQGQVQVCKGNAECQNKKSCIPQSCAGGANLDLCGLTPDPPYSCKPQ